MYSFSFNSFKRYVFHSKKELNFSVLKADVKKQLLKDGVIWDVNNVILSSTKNK